jgi:hypothetical protein
MSSYIDDEPRMELNRLADGGWIMVRRDGRVVWRKIMLDRIEQVYGRRKMALVSRGIDYETNVDIEKWRNLGNGTLDRRND